MKRSSNVSVSSDTVFEGEGSSLLRHEILLMGCGAIQNLLGLSAWLSEDKSWECDLESGILHGDIVLDETPVSVNISSLGGQQEYCAMLDSRLSSCDGMVFFVGDKLDEDSLDLLFEQIRQVKDGQLFSMVLVLNAGEDSSLLHSNAKEWAETHYGATIASLTEEDNASLAQCVCELSVQIHRLKSSLAKLITPGSSPCTSRSSGSMRSSLSTRSSSTSSSVGCMGMNLHRSKLRRKNSLSPSTTSSVASRLSREEKLSQISKSSTGGTCRIM